MIETAEVTESAAPLPTEKLQVARQTAVGGTWMVGARLVSRVIDLGSLMVLAHRLTPNDFGLVAIAMTVILIVEAILELPLSQALVRLPFTVPAHYDTAFTLGVLRGLGLMGIICAISWPFAHFYNDMRLLPLVIALSIAPVARGLVSPRISDFSRRLDFSPDFVIEFSGKLFAFFVALTIAIAARSYWAIAAGTIVAPLAGTIVSYMLAPYRPRFSLSELNVFSEFLGWITAAQVVSAFNWQTDRLMLGKLQSRAALGLFTTADQISNVPQAALFAPMLRPLLSAFSLLRDQPKRLASSYQSSASAVVTVGLPILVGQSLVAYPLVRLMFGQQWLGAAPLLRWLAISLIPTLFAIPMGPLVMSFGKTYIFFRRNTFELCVKLPLVIVGAIKFQFMGVVVARCISETATVIYCMLIVRGLVGLSLREQVLGPWRSIAAAASMAVVVGKLLPLVVHPGSGLPLAVEIALSVVVGGVTYVAALWTLWSMSGRPSGIEAMIMGRVEGLLNRGRTPKQAVEGLNP